MGIIDNVLSFFTGTGDKEVKKAIGKTTALVKRNPDRAYAVNSYWHDTTETQLEGIYGYATRSEKLQLDGMELLERGYNQTPKVRSSYNRLMSRIFYAPMVIVAPDDSEEAKVLKKYNEQIFHEIKGTVENKLKELTKISMLTGYSLGEIVPKMSESELFKNKRVIKAIMSKRIGLFEFITDAYDDVLSVHSLVDYSLYFPPERFFIMSYDSWFENPYGTSQWDALSSLLKMRQAVYQNAAIYSNWFTSPIPTVTYEDDTLVEVARTIADNIKAHTNLAVPEGVTIKFLEASKSNNNPFLHLLEWIDDQISESVVGYDLSKEVGSRAADEVKATELDMFVESMRRYIEECYNEQIIRRFTQHNFPIEQYPLDKYPKVQFREIKGIDKREFAEVARISVDIGALDFEKRINDLVYYREQLGYPRLSSEELKSIKDMTPDVDLFSYNFEADTVTNFPNKGDNDAITLRNSEYKQFDYQYALSLKEKYPKIWAKGGNIRGNDTFILWGRARAGKMTPDIESWIKEREAWAARHFKNFQLAGVIAQVKWGVVGSRGEAYMKSVIEEAKKKYD